MKILYLLFAFLFLAFLSESGNAQRQCKLERGRCFYGRCTENFMDIGRKDCGPRSKCCVSRYGK